MCGSGVPAASGCSGDDWGTGLKGDLRRGDREDATSDQVRQREDHGSGLQGGIGHGNSDVLQIDTLG